MSPKSPAAPLAAKLATPEGAALLAERWIRDALGRPVGELVVASEAARAVHEALSAMAESDAASTHLLARVDEVCKRYENEKRALDELLPEELSEGALKLARRPHQPHRQMVLRVLDREPVRQLIRGLLVEALVEFGRKMAAPISGSRVGKGLGALGSFAGAVGAGVLGAVGGELEKQAERRAAEFADTALSKVLGRIVDTVSDPRRGAEQAELRAAIVEGVLEVPAREWVAEVRRSEPASLIAELRKTLLEFSQRSDARALLEHELEVGLAPVAETELGALLDELGIRAAIERAAREFLVARITAFDWAELFDALQAG